MRNKQINLFDHAPYRDAGVEGLPLITEPNSGSVLVYTPGHLYKPSPVQVDRIGKQAGPGALEASEARFVAGLIRHLDPDHAQDSEVVQRIPAAIKQAGRDFFLLRNLDRSPDGTRLRMGDGNWFYPDFIFWLLNHAGQTEGQTMAFIDPKGLLMGTRGGWNNHKVLCFAYKLVEIAEQLGHTHDRQGRGVNFAMKGVFISTTQRERLEEETRATQEFHVYDDAGSKVFPGYDDFSRAGVFFAECGDHIERMMAYLISGPSLLDKVMARAASAQHLAAEELPEDEIGCFFRWSLTNQGGLEPALGELIRFSLTATDEAHVVRRIQQHAREKLHPFMEKRLWHTLTNGVEDVNRIEQPCRTLLERYFANH